MKPMKAFCFSLLLFTSAVQAAVPMVELPFAPGDTLAYSYDGCERVKIDLGDLPSPVTLELGRDGHYAFYSNGVITATRDVSGLGTTVTEPNWSASTFTFTLDTLAERTFDVKTGLASTNLTYSGTGWDEPGAGTEATIKCRNGEGDETTLASGLVGTGEKPWTPFANGTYTLAHTSGKATETATITVANLITVTIAVGDLAAKHLTGKVVWNGSEMTVTGQSFELPKGSKDAKLVLTAEKGYRPDDSLGTAKPTGDGRRMVEVSLDDLMAEGGALAIPEAVAYRVRLVGVTNRSPWNGKIDVVASVAGLDAAMSYQLVTTLTLGGATKRVCRELGVGQDATYTNTVDCAALFGENVVGDVSVKLSLVEVTDAGGETVGESDEGTVAVDARATKEINGSSGAVTVDLTYSGDGWGEAVGGSAAITVAFEGATAQPFATGLTGVGTVPWNPEISGTYVFTHTAGGVAETATYKLFGFPGEIGKPWKVGADDAAAVTAYVKDGYLYLAGEGEVTAFADGAPWGAYEQLGSPLAGAVLPRTVTLPASVLATLPISVKGGTPAPVPPAGAVTSWDALTNAVTTAASGAEIAVGADITEAGGELLIPAGKSVAIKLYGKTVTCRRVTAMGALTVGDEADAVGRIVASGGVQIAKRGGSITLLTGPLRGTYTAFSPGLAVILK